LAIANYAVFRWNWLGQTYVRFFFYFAAMLFLWWLTPLAFRGGFCSLLQELQAPIWYGADGIYQVKSYWQLRAQSKEVLARQIVELSRSLAHCKLQLQNQMGEIALWKDDQRFHSLEAFHCIHCRVLRRDEKAWWGEVVLGRGRCHGIGENMAVVGADGLIGRTVRVFSHHCIAILATDPRFRMVAHIRGDPRPLIYEGVAQTGFRWPIGRISHVPLDVAIPEGGGLVITSSPLSTTYPEGLPIGTVKCLKKSANGAFQEGIIYLNGEILTLREGAILKRKENIIDD
jgi:rod shape-determining protein MreC